MSQLEILDGLIEIRLVWVGVVAYLAYVGLCPSTSDGFSCVRMSSSRSGWCWFVYGTFSCPKLFFRIGLVWFRGFSERIPWRTRAEPCFASGLALSFTKKLWNYSKLGIGDFFRVTRCALVGTHRGWRLALLRQTFNNTTTRMRL